MKTIDAMFFFTVYYVVFEFDKNNNLQPFFKLRTKKQQFENTNFRRII